MDELTSEQEMLVRSVRRLAQEKIAPVAEEIEEKGEYPWEILELFKKNGLSGLLLPEQYCGGGADVFTFALVVEEIAKVCTNSSTILQGQVLSTKPLLVLGSEEQKQEYLPPVARGEVIPAFGLTEPGAGSDPGSMVSRAVRDDGDYILNGTKRFISDADVAGFITVFAKTDPSQGAKGVSAFIVEKGTPGLTIGKREKKMGSKAHQACEVILEDCRVPAANRLGPEGGALSAALKALDTCRPIVAARAVGLAQGALDYAIEYAKQRQQFGRPIAKFQAIQFMLAEMATRIEAARQLVYKACREVDRGSPEMSKYGAMAKFYASDVAMKVTIDAVQILGGYGYMEDYPLARRMKDAKLTQIVEGTNQIQRTVVARHILGDF
ncbi:MAG: acyl-CoA dehydrogenase [Clostridia bacterium]|nr:MAG: acyl-CoA dehydrogenase [Clostridia bacterium]